MKTPIFFPALMVASAVLAGCAVETSQTRDEFKVNMTAHSSLTIVDTYIANRPFDAVVTTIQKKWNECYNIQFVTKRSHGLEKTRVADTFHPHTRKVSNTLVEMTLQQTSEGMKSLNNVPPGGLYKVALDIERLPGNKTKLSWFSNSAYADSWDKNKQWADGKNAPCEND
jgi:hypothetical protein